MKQTITVLKGDFVRPPCPQGDHAHTVWVPVYLPFLEKEEQRLQNRMISQMEWEHPWWVTTSE